MTTPLDSAGPAATYLFRRTDPLRALVLDLDALADLRFDGYRVVFNAAFAALGLPVQWSVERYRQLLALPDERLRVAAELRKRCIGTDCDVLVRVLVEQVCDTKEALLQRVMLDAGLSPRPGLNDLVTDAFVAQVPIAVITDGRRRWAQPLVSQLVGAGLVEAVVTADDIGVPPRGDALFRQALAELGVAPHDALAIVGSATGLRGADAAGVATVLVDGDADTADAARCAAAAVRRDYSGTDGGLRLAQCRRLHSQWWADHSVPAA